MSEEIGPEHEYKSVISTSPVDVPVPPKVESDKNPTESSKISRFFHWVGHNSRAEQQTSSPDPIFEPDTKDTTSSQVTESLPLSTNPEAPLVENPITEHIESSSIYSEKEKEDTRELLQGVVRMNTALAVPELTYSTEDEDKSGNVVLPNTSTAI
jgi:hypothetical protein